MLSRHDRTHKNSQLLWLCSCDLHNVKPEEIIAQNSPLLEELPVADGYRGIESPGSSRRLYTDSGPSSTEWTL